MRFPKQTSSEIREKIDLIGWNDNTGVQCLMNCKDRLDDQEWAQYKAAFPAVIEETVRSGVCTHAFLLSLGLPGGELNLDGKNVKSWRAILTGTAAQERVLAKMKAKEQKEEKQKEKEERKNVRHASAKLRKMPM